MKGDSIESHGNPVVTWRDHAKATSLHVGTEMEEQVSCATNGGEVGLEPLIGCVDESCSKGRLFNCLQAPLLVWERKDPQLPADEVLLLQFPELR